MRKEVRLRRPVVYVGSRGRRASAGATSSHGTLMSDAVPELWKGTRSSRALLPAPRRDRSGSAGRAPAARVRRRRPLRPSRRARWNAPLELLDGDEERRTGWGLWAEISAADARVTLDRWSDPDQAAQPPFSGALANSVSVFPETIGLPLIVQLTGPTTRPALAFPASCDHPFAVECRRGVTVHRVHEWLSRFRLSGQEAAEDAR